MKVKNASYANAYFNRKDANRNFALKQIDMANRNYRDERDYNRLVKNDEFNEGMRLAQDQRAEETHGQNMEMNQQKIDDWYADEPNKEMKRDLEMENLLSQQDEMDKSNAEKERLARWTGLIDQQRSEDEQTTEEMSAAMAAVYQSIKKNGGVCDPATLKFANNLYRQNNLINGDDDLVSIQLSEHGGLVYTFRTPKGEFYSTGDYNGTFSGQFETYGKTPFEKMQYKKANDYRLKGQKVDTPSERIKAEAYALNAQNHYKNEKTKQMINTATQINKLIDSLYKMIDKDNKEFNLTDEQRTAAIEKIKSYTDWEQEIWDSIRNGKSLDNGPSAVPPPSQKTGGQQTTSPQANPQTTQQGTGEQSTEGSESGSKGMKIVSMTRDSFELENGKSVKAGEIVRFPNGSYMKAPEDFSKTDPRDIRNWTAVRAFDVRKQVEEQKRNQRDGIKKALAGGGQSQPTQQQEQPARQQAQKPVEVASAKPTGRQMSSMAEDLSKASQEGSSENIDEYMGTLENGNRDDVQQVLEGLSSSKLSEEQVDNILDTLNNNEKFDSTDPYSREVLDNFLESQMEFEEPPKPTVKKPIKKPEEKKVVEPVKPVGKKPVNKKVEEPKDSAQNTTKSVKAVSLKETLKKQGKKMTYKDLKTENVFTKKPSSKVVKKVPKEDVGTKNGLGYYMDVLYGGDKDEVSSVVNNISYDEISKGKIEDLFEAINGNDRISEDDKKSLIKTLKGRNKKPEDHKTKYFKAAMGDFNEKVNKKVASIKKTKKYVMGEDEDFYSVCTKFGVVPSVMRKLNNTTIDDDGDFKEGSTLIIPDND